MLLTLHRAWSWFHQLREPSPVAIATRLGEYPGVGQILKSFICLPFSAAASPGTLRAAARPPAAGGWRRGLQ